MFANRSKIQGLGLYAARDLERHTMVIEYIGELIRSELADFREKQYEAKVSSFSFCIARFHTILYTFCYSAACKFIQVYLILTLKYYWFYTLSPDALWSDVNAGNISQVSHKIYESLKISCINTAYLKCFLPLYLNVVVLPRLE